MNKEIVIVIKGEAQSLQQALAGAQRSTQSLQRATHHASEETAGFGKQARVTAEMIGMLGAESSESVLKVQGLGRAFKEMQETLGGFGAAIRATIGSFLLFAGLDFLKESAQEAMSSEAAWNRLTNAYKGNAKALEEVKRNIEDNAQEWDRWGVTAGQAAQMAATAVSRGMDPTKVLNPDALKSVAQILGTDIPSALDLISRPRGVQQVLSRLGLSPLQLRTATREMRGFNAEQRALYLENLAQRAPGGGLGGITAAQSFTSFQTAMANLREEVGTALLPALTALAQALTGILAGLDKATKPFGGLANVLKTLLIPMLMLGFALFTNLKGVIFSLIELLIGRLSGSFTQTAASMAEADVEVEKLASDIRMIPETWATTALFIPDAAKEAWIANIASVPRGPIVTTAAFDAAGATAGLSAFRNVLAIGLSTALSVGVSYAIMSGALKPVTDAIGHLVGHITRWIAVPFTKTIRIVGHIWKWAVVPLRYGAKVVGHIWKWAVVPLTYTANVVGHITRWAASVVSPTVKLPPISIPKQTVSVNKITIDKHVKVPNIPIGVTPILGGTTLTIPSTVKVVLPKVNTISTTAHITKVVIDKKTKIPTINTGDVVKITGKVQVSGSASIDTAHLKPGTKIEIPAQAIINGVIEKPGTKLIINAKGRITDVITPAGIDLKVPVKGTITGFDAGALGSALKQALDHAHITVRLPAQPKQKDPLPVKVVNKVDLGFGTIMAMAAANIAAVAIGSVMANVITRLLPMDKIVGWLKKLWPFGKKGGGTGGGRGSGLDDPALDDMTARIRQNILTPVEDVISEAEKQLARPLPAQPSFDALNVSKITFTALSTIPVLLNMTKLKFNLKLPTVSFPSINWSSLVKPALIGLGAALVAGFLAYVVPLAVTAAIDVGTILISGVAEGATAGLATPLVAILLGTVGAASLVAYTKIFHNMGHAGDKEAAKLKKQHGGLFGDLLGTIGKTFAHAFKATGSALGSIGGAIIGGIKTGILKAITTVYSIGYDIVHAVQTGVKRGLISIENLFISMFNAILQKIKNAPGIGGLFGGVKPIPPIPIPGGKGGKFGAYLIDPGTVASINRIAQHALNQSYNTTIHATINVNGVHDETKVARQITSALSEMVRGAKSTRRLSG